MPLTGSDWHGAILYIIEIKGALVSLDEAVNRRDENRCQRLFEKITTAAQKGLAEVTPIVD